MPPIKIDTDLLRHMAKRLEMISCDYEKIGSELAVRSNQVPSYGGQLSTPAHKAGMTSQYEANSLRDLLKEHAVRLENIAREFERVDGETVEQLNYWEIILQNLGDFIAMPDPNPFLNIDFEALYGRFHQNQKTPDGCADYSLSMVCNIYYSARGESTSRCDVNKISEYLEKILIGKFPWENGGTTPWGVGIGLDSLGIPNSFKPDGSLEVLKDALNQNKLVVVSIGQINDPINGTWGHVKVIVGMEGDDFLVLDPAYNPASGDPKLLRVNKSEFLKDWWYPPFHPCWIIE